jgi:hypothetical protein
MEMENNTTSSPHHHHRKSHQLQHMKSKDTTQDSSHHHHHHHHGHSDDTVKTTPKGDSTPKRDSTPSSPMRKFGGGGGGFSPNSKSFRQKSRMIGSFMSFSSFHEKQENNSAMHQFQPGGNGVDVDGDDDGWQLLLDESVLVLKKVERLKLILENMSAKRPKSTGNVPGSNSVDARKSMTSSTSNTSVASSSIKRKSHALKSPSVPTSPKSASSSPLASPLASPPLLSTQKSVQFIDSPQSRGGGGEGGGSSVASSGGTLGSAPLVKANEMHNNGNGGGSTLDDDRAEQEAKRKVENALIKVQREQFAKDFGTVVAKVKWEMAGKTRQEVKI